MNSLAFDLVYQEAQKYSAWNKKLAKLLQSGEEETERENVKSLKQAKEYYSSLMRGAA